MTLNEYQKAADRTSGDLSPWDKIRNGCYGLNGEAGECIDILKKVEFQGHAFDPVKLVDELGDVLWYVAQTATGLGIALEDVAQHNVEKLKKRYPDGFDAERSIHRPEYEKEKDSMLLTRNVEFNTNIFEIGDVIRFDLTNGEKVEAMAVKKEFDGTIFLLVDCLADEERMNEEYSNHGGYEASDLRNKLTGEILNRFPSEIQEQMIAFPSGDFLRLPTEREIFGCNTYGEDEDSSVEQWKPMELRRNRIAFQGHNGGWEWYWLQNKRKNSSAYFVIVDDDGNADCDRADCAIGVRPAFKIKNP